jgi:glycerol uptake operon antiterminator
MDTDRLIEALGENPIIAALRDMEDLKAVLSSNAKVVFVLFGSIIDIGEICNTLKQHGKIVFVHLDMVNGLKGDAKGIEYIKRFADPFGILTTKPMNIKHAKSLGLYTIMRMFILDSLSLKTGVKNIAEVQPNAVEIMPGIANKIIINIKKETHLPIIAGGLIQTKKDVFDSIGAGAIAISTTAHELWELD